MHLLSWLEKLQVHLRSVNGTVQVMVHGQFHGVRTLKRLYVNLRASALVLSNSYSTVSLLFRRYTRTLPINKVIRREDSQTLGVATPDDVRAQMLLDSRVYGSLQHLLTVFLNCMLDQLLPLCENDEKRLHVIELCTKSWFLHRIFKLLSVRLARMMMMFTAVVM